MKNLFQAARVLLLDLASTVVFLAIYLLTDNLFLAVGVGMALGIAQIGWQLFTRKPVEALQWLSPIECVEVAGDARFLNQLSLLPDSVPPTFSI